MFTEPTKTRHLIQEQVPPLGIQPSSRRVRRLDSEVPLAAAEVFVPVILGFLATFLLVFPAMASEPVRWSQDPSLVPWETMTTSGDADRAPAQSRDDLKTRRSRLRKALDTGGLSDRERALALTELGDLFRDEARLVLAEDAADPWRVPLRTTPAWLQLEFALRHYNEAVRSAPDAVDADGRLTLLTAVLLRRLGKDDGFDDVVKVIRTYRGTPYVEMAKLAVGDHHFERGNLDKARTAYRLVRNNRDPELSNYARYRLASIHALQGEADTARQLLEDLVEQPDEGALQQMLSDASRAALANHKATEQGLDELIPWMHQACAAQDEACARDLRSSAADTFHALGDLRSDAWLHTVDATPPVATDLAMRQRLVGLMLGDTDSMTLLTEVEAVCGADDDMCRAELAFSLSSFYELAGDPDGLWLTDYVRLPRLPRLPAAHRLVAQIAYKPQAPRVELSQMLALCADSDRRCPKRVRQHLRIVWGRLSRLNDAAWLTFVEQGLPVPGPPDAEILSQQLVAERANAATMLSELEPLCDNDAICEAELSEILVGYYAAIGQDSSASWLIALGALPEMPLPHAQREALQRSVRAAKPAREVLRALLSTCDTLTVDCFNSARVAVEVFFRAADQHRDAIVLSDLGVLTSRRVEPVAFEALVDLTLDQVASGPALARIESVCTNQGESCAADARALLADWYEDQNLFAEQQAVLRVDAAPELGLWDRLSPAFMRVARTAPDAATAVQRVRQLCPSTSADCQRTLEAALIGWYQGQGRAADAQRAESVIGRD
ncbi:MAG: tetratricopeptide repeat protein [Myxococcota bacterium]